MRPALPNSDLQSLLELLFESYPLYIDHESRTAVDAVLIALVKSKYGDAVLSVLVKFLKQESLKKGIAHVNAHRLNDWCSVLLVELVRVPIQFSKFGVDLALVNARLLETCVGMGDDRRGSRIAHSAQISTWRALRAILREEAISEAALSSLVNTLTSKGTSPTAGNAVYLGAIAGVMARISAIKPKFETYKPDYYAFYVREIVGSRTQLPYDISNALYDFFASFATLEELRKEVIPPIEKALLRAPEVVLNDIISPMVLAHPASTDFSDILLGNMLKPLLSNVKSTNPAIRAGVLRTFTALVSRSHNDDATTKITDEILNPLKQGKVSGADQKVLHAQMLAALPRSASLSQKIPGNIAAVALKEPSEPAVVAEVSTMTEHLTFGLANGVTIDKAVSDAFIKGIADKRVPVKKLWATRAADIWWNLSDSQLTQPDILAFCQATLPKLVEVWQEVNANPLPATQNGLVTVGHYVAALLLEKAQHMKDEKISTIYKKTDVLTQSLTVQPKPSFLLHSKVYSKLSTEDDVVVAARALTALAPFVIQESRPKETQISWAHAMIYLIVAQGVSSKAKVVAKHALTQVYLRHSSAAISGIIVQGIWSWHRSSEQEDKDSAAVASKTGSKDLGVVLSCISLSPEVVQKLGATIEKTDLQAQALSLIVLARPEMIPRVSWIDLCLRIGVDPGDLVRASLGDCVSAVNEVTEVRLPPSEQADEILTSLV